MWFFILVLFHCSQVILVVVSKLLLHIRFISSFCPHHQTPLSRPYTATYNPSFLMRNLKHTHTHAHHSWKKKKKALALQLHPLYLPPLSPSLRPLILPKKRAKDVERWLISPRYNLTVTLRCHLLWRTALFMSSTLHVSHFPAN